METKRFEFKDAQENRIWIHNKDMGFGKWFTNREIQELFSIQSNLKENPNLCPYCGNT